MKYQLAYKCPLCGTLIVEKEQEATQEICLAWIKRQIKYTEISGYRFLDYPNEIPHMCKDGSVGLATIAGFRRVPKGRLDPKGKRGAIGICPHCGTSEGILWNPQTDKCCCLICGWVDEIHPDDSGNGGK